MDFAKTLLLLLELKLLAMWERIGEALKLVYRSLPIWKNMVLAPIKVALDM